MIYKCNKSDYGRLLSVVVRIFVFILNNSGRGLEFTTVLKMPRSVQNMQ